MSNAAESTFQSTLRSFNLSRSSNRISLPSEQLPSSDSSPFASFRNTASNLFSNVTDRVQGYIPLGTNGEEEEEPWYQMSRLEKVMACGLCLILGILCFFLAFFLFLSLVPITPGKFAGTFTLGSILILISVALLHGPMAHLRHMLSIQRLPFTLSYTGSMALTLYASLIARKYLLTLLSAIIQLIALVWYFGSYIPGGVTTLRYGTSYILRQGTSILPI